MTFSKKILVVDDNVVNRRILCKILENTYEVLEAENGIDALNILRNRTSEIGLVLLDIVMPVMNGYEFLEAVKANETLSSVPIIVTTQQNKEDDEEKALSEGASDFLTKPYRPKIILHRIANLLKLRETAALITVVERDTLTGVFAKEFFYRKATELLLADNDTQYDLLCVDIENFKLVNDMFGMKIGDDLLCYCANLILETAPENSICGRIGGDVFAVIFPRIDEYKASFFKNAEERLNSFYLNIKLRMNFGVFVISDKRLPINIICDRALLTAKTIKGQYGFFYAFYDDSLRKKLLDEQFIVDNMELALREKQFQIFLQPKYNLKTNKIAGAEALVRWDQPQKGFMMPNEFIPIFEKNGFITRLDFFVWEEVCKLLQKWNACGLMHIPVSVNVSRVDIYNQDLVEVLVNLVEEYSIPPSQIHLEITESAYTENPKQIIEVVSHLKEYGFIIEMDDFGKGYSSLNMLSELPIDVLKLDIRFIQAENTSINNKNILSFIISLAKWLDLTVVAEGVETEDQIERLRNMDCNYVQGYFYAKPMPESDFYRYLMSGDIDENCQNLLSNDYFTESVYPTDVEASADKCVMLIVDDKELNRFILADMFRSEFNIVFSQNSAAALEYLKENGYKTDIVLLDLIMPGMDGFDMLSVMKDDAELCKIPVVVTSQLGGAAEKKAMMLGAADFISKPYIKEICISRVHNVLAFAKKNATELRASELMREAYYDYTTGILNRRGFDMAVEKLTDATDDFYAIYMLDIDDFKGLNDTYGHSVGDERLRSFAGCIRSSLCSDDLFARIGGDEFIVLIKNVSSACCALANGKKLCDLLNHNIGYSFSCSAGVSVFKPISDIYNALEKADRAMYQAKKSGKNRCCLYEPETTLAE